MSPQDPLLARLIAAGDGPGEAGNGAAYVIVPGGETGLADGVADGLRRYLRGNMEGYSDEEKDRIERWMGGRPDP